MTLNEGYISDYAESLAREKGISRGVIIQVIRDVLQEFFTLKDIESEINIDFKTGAIKIFTILENQKTPFSFVDLSRIQAMQLRKNIIRAIEGITREEQYKNFKDQTGQLIQGIVKKSDFRSIIVNINGFLAILPRNCALLQDRFQVGDSIYACIDNVYPLPKRGYQIYLSRISNDFLLGLLRKEVPELREASISIKSIYRDPGSRAKIAVSAEEGGIDPVGCIVGMRGSRIKSVTEELKGERIDIITWTDNQIDFVIKAFTPVEVLKVIVDDERGKLLTVVVPDTQFSFAIGRGGQNVSLISKLVGFKIKVVTEQEDKIQRDKEYEQAEENLKSLNLQQISMQFLINEGFQNIEDIARCSMDELIAVEGITTQEASEIKSSARKIYLEEKKLMYSECIPMGAETNLLDLLSEYFLLHDIKNLVKKDIFSLTDIAKMDSFELRDLIGNHVLFEDIDEVIMSARGTA